MKNKELKILLAAPRGFCAGVERAIEIVENWQEDFNENKLSTILFHNFICSTM